MKHIMFDVEALGKPETGTILQVGAVLFDREANLIQFEDISPERQFLSTIKLESVNLANIDPSSLRWWLTQTDDAARASVFIEDGVEESDLLAQFHTFFVKSDPELLISSTPSYDIGHLYALYARSGRSVPWSHRIEHGTRELQQLALQAGRLPPATDNPVPHNALHDAIAQAKDYTRTWQALQLPLGF